MQGYIYLNTYATRNALLKYYSESSVVIRRPFVLKKQDMVEIIYINIKELLLICIKYSLNIDNRMIYRVPILSQNAVHPNTFVAWYFCQNNFSDFFSFISVGYSDLTTLFTWLNNPGDNDIFTVSLELHSTCVQVYFTHVIPWWKCYYEVLYICKNDTNELCTPWQVSGCTMKCINPV